MGADAPFLVGMTGLGRPGMFGMRGWRTNFPNASLPCKDGHAGRVSPPGAAAPWVRQRFSWNQLSAGCCVVRRQKVLLPGSAVTVTVFAPVTAVLAVSLT